MESAFPDAMVTKAAYSDLVDQMPNDPKDRHVLAAAISSEADVLVTANTKHFRHLPPNCAVTVQHPDVFLNECLTSNPRELIGVLQDMADDRNYPLDTVPGILNALHKTVPNFAMQAFDVLSRYLP